MDDKEFATWVDATQEHMNMVYAIIEDRKLLKKTLENHLSKFFNWIDDLKFNRDFSQVEMVVDEMIIDDGKMDGLMMPWAIEPYGDYTFRITVYPFGVPNDEGEM